MKKLNAKYHVLSKKNEIISSDYGWRILEGKKQWHKGIDLSKPAQWVISPCAGVVTATRNNIKGVDKVNYTAGNFVSIKTNNGLILRFLHLKKGTVKVKVGDTVKEGTKLGYMGNTGYSLATHLHFDINSGGDYVDPKPYLKGEKPLTKPITTLKVGDKVEITAKGNSNYQGTGKVSYGIGYTRYILKIVRNANYPYKVGSKLGITTGYYKKAALKKVS